MIFRRSIRVAAVFAVAVSVAFAINATGQVVQESVSELDSIGIDEKLGDHIPMELSFTDDRGRPVTLGDYFIDERPVILVLAYYECPMLCNLILNGLSEGIGKLDWKPGKDYQIVTVSINPRETFELAAAKKKNYLEALGMPSADEGWSFLVGQESQSKALADAVGFRYYWVEERREYAHAAAIYLLAADGKITRYLYGIQFDPGDLKLALLEASQGSIGNTLDKLILYCYHYDPDSRGYVIFAGNVMRLGGAATLVIMLAFLGLLWRRERKRKGAVAA